VFELVLLIKRILIWLRFSGVSEVTLNSKTVQRLGAGFNVPELDGIEDTPENSGGSEGTAHLPGYSRENN
jgi:hypothetical protein